MRKEEKIRNKKKSFYPKMTKKATEMIRLFFLKTRHENKLYHPPKITMIDYELLIKKAEELAKSRKSDKVEIEDAKKAINAWLKNELLMKK